MLPGQEANIDNFGILFFDLLHNDCMLRELIRIASMRILMSTHNIIFHDRIRKFP